MLIFHCETAGKRSDFFPTKFLYADWDSTPGHLHSSPPGRDHAGHGYELHRITFYLFHWQVNFVHFGRLAIHRHIYGLAVRLRSLALPLEAGKPPMGFARHERLKRGALYG
jgi:hypothetical protein